MQTKFKLIKIKNLQPHNDKERARDDGHKKSMKGSYKVSVFRILKSKISTQKKFKSNIF